jgi:hypothetical protein
MVRPDGVPAQVKIIEKNNESFQELMSLQVVFEQTRRSFGRMKAAEDPLEVEFDVDRLL